MMSHQVALIKRELWEHRAIYVTPAVIGLVMTLLTLTGSIAASGFGEMVDVAIVGLSNLGDAERRAALTAFLLGNTVSFMIGTWILTIFYCLDALYAERKDKSILFWRSLPITDAETAVSKLLTAVLVIPLVSFVGIIVTHLVNLVLASVFVSAEGGGAGHLIWGSVPFIDVWTTLLIVVLATPLWLAPLIGWFLFVSAWAKRSPLLTAFLPIIVAPVLEYVVFRSSHLWSAIGSRFNVAEIPIFDSIETLEMFEDDDFHLVDQSLSLLSLIDIGKFVTSPAMWAGLVVCGLFVTAAIYVRRYRDDS